MLNARLAQRSSLSAARAFASSSVFGDKVSAQLRRFPATQVSVLANNIRVATQKVAGESAAVAVYLDVGSRFDNFENNGAANLAANLSLQSTPAALDAGLNLSANVDREVTVLKAQCLKSQTGLAVQLLGQAVTNNAVSAEAFEVERQAALKQVAAMDSRPQSLVHDLLHATAYHTTSLALPVVGSLPTLTALNAQSVADYKKTHYTGQRLVVVATGDVNHADVVKQVETAFGALPGASAEQVVRPASLFTGSDVRVRNDGDEVTHIAYAFPTAGATDADNVALQVATSLLGGSWNASQLPTFQSQLLLDVVADAAGVEAHQVQAFHRQYADTGLLGVHVATKDQYAVHALAHSLTDGFVRLSNESSPPMLYEAKQRIVTSIVSNLESASAQADEIGTQLLQLGRRVHPLEAVARVDAVDGGAVKLAVSRFCNDKCHALAAIGQTYELMDYLWFRRRSYSLRY